MSLRGATVGAVLGLLAFAPGCDSGSENIYDFEEDYLSEDLLDLMTIVFQASEQAFVGDPVFPEDVIEVAQPANSFTAFYALPEGDRLNLGFGSGDVYLQVTEDGVVNEDPLAFDITTTDALRVDVFYDFVYLGETLGGRPTDAAFVVTFTATRASTAEPFLVEYFVDGDTFLGSTYARIETQFRAPGRPRDGIDGYFGDAAGLVDDPDVYDDWEMDLDYFEDGFRAQGDVGCCGFFEREFWYSQLF
jgi:hypothetical protein